MRGSYRLAATLASGIAVLYCASGLLAYEVKPVPEGGTLTGTVKFAGEATTPGELEVTKDKSACGLLIIDETLVVNDGLLQNVVVAVGGITAGKEPVAGKPKIGNQNCRFVPHVQTMQVGTKLTIDNSDPILHNTHGIYEDGRTAFNLALPLQNQSVKKRIKKPGVIAMKCDAGHTWMSAYVVAFEHPYHAVTGEDGSFTISGIPPGTYELSVWHERLPAQTVEVSVAAGDTTRVEIELASAE